MRRANVPKYATVLLLPFRPDWNLLAERAGLGLPLWFRQQLRQVDPEWELQFIPPDTFDPDGVPARVYPLGIWDICNRLPGSRMLNPKVVFSLADIHGLPAPPTPGLIRLLRHARQLCFRGESAKLRRVMAQAFTALQQSRADGSQQALERSTEEVSRLLLKDRQWTNRISLHLGRR